MSTCISAHGEYSAHELDEEFTCTRCGVLDEDAMRAELRRLRARPDAPVAADGEFVRGGVCLLCGGGVLSSGEHIDLDRHAAEVERITAGAVVTRDERDPACVEAWPGCESGYYDPRCCRFPKSCSPHMSPARRAYLGLTVADGPTEGDR